MCRSFSPCACSSYPIMLSKKSSSVCRWYATRLPIRTSAPQSSATFRMEEAPRLYRVTACILLNRVISFKVIRGSCGSLVSGSGEMSKSVLILFILCCPPKNVLYSNKVIYVFYKYFLSLISDNINHLYSSVNTKFKLLSFFYCFYCF